MTFNLGHVTGATGNGIESIEKISTVELVDTYQINFTDGTSTTFEVTNGKDGSGGGDIVTAWEQTLSDEKIPSEKLTKTTIDTKVDKVTGKGLSTNDFTTTLKNKLDGIEAEANKYTHPSSKQCNYAPDLSNYVQKSSTTGLIKNDGTIDTSAYITSSALSNYVQKSQTSGLLKNDGTVMTSGTGSTNYSAGNHTHSGYVSATKVTSWSSTVSDSNVPSEKLVKDSLDAIEDLIGDAIDYINL